ncbi:MAG TPA: 50S ribosomal protein L21 [Gemmata sp.]|jgi:large subunit ribosomal protein L21|nr:50S ribosomal protein L21 [Gemmata sp.]
MYAIFEDGSRQYRVEKDSVLLIDYKDATTGQTIELNKVLLYQSGSETLIGQPLVEGAKIIAEVIDRRATKKTITQKFRRRKASKRLKGHTQPYLKVKIKHILKAGETVPVSETPPAPQTTSDPTPSPAPTGT